MISAAVDLPRSRRTLEIAAVAALLGATALGVAYAILHSGPLGWDESVYAVKARSFVTDVPASGWALYRPPALAYLGTVAGAFGFSDASLRAVTLALGLGTLAAAWGLARSMWGMAAGLVALLGVISAPIMLDEIRVFHNDLAAAGLIVLVMLLLWHELERRPEPTKLLLAAGPLVAAAFYLRYGVLAAAGGVAVASLVLWAPKLRRHWRLVGATAAVTAVLFLPHALHAIATTGSPLGIVRAAAQQVDTTGPLTSAIQYAKWFPLKIAGPVALALTIAGLAGAAVVWSRWLTGRGGRPDARRYLFLFVAAGVAAVGIVFVSHAEQRYLAFPLMLGIVAGAGATVSAGRWALDRARLAHRGAGAWGVAALAVILVTGAVLYVGWHRIRSVERYAGRNDWIEQAGRAIAGDAQRPCTVVTTLVPPIAWYSSCVVYPPTRPPDKVLGPLPAGQDAYAVFTTIDGQRATPQATERYRAVATAPPIATVPSGASPPLAEVYRLRH